MASEGQNGRLGKPDGSGADGLIAPGLTNLFYDQSHLIREMRHFLGRTPSRLAKGQNSLLSEAIGLRNYREFRPNVARIPGD